MKKVAIVIPTHKKDFSDAERLSLKHLFHFLGKYDKYFVVPEGLKINYPGIVNKKFNKKYFKNRNTYSELLLKKEFYQEFEDYEYILIYQLDCLVFSDQLLYWCNQEYDYIGAPWYKTILQEETRGIEEYNNPDTVGNGGLSLRHIKNSVKALKKAKKSLFLILKDFILSETLLFKKREKRLRSYLRPIRLAYLLSAAHRRTHRFGDYNEDWFWSFEVQRYMPEFRIPSVEVAIKFAFEAGPKHCFEKNNKQLPFGCHAWEKYDKEFWLPYLLK
jgi:hypothetical protein